jgi:glutamyl-tRNA reductase
MAKVKFDLMNTRVTFNNVPIHVLSKFSFKDVNAASEEFKKIEGVDECIIIQTASRVEIFTVSNTQEIDSPDARRDEGKSLILNKIKDTWVTLSELEQIDIDHFDQTIEVYKGNDVYMHLLRLASGVDSFVVGKQEVYDEIVDALQRSKNAGNSGKILNKLFETSIRISEKIRSATGISKDVISLGDISVDIVDEKAGIDAKKKILLLGTGVLAAMIGKNLNKKDIPFDLASRTIDRAEGFSKVIGGTPVNFEDVFANFDKYDIIFVATTADYFMIDHERIKLKMEDKKKGTLILDISQPRAVAEDVTSLPGIKLLFRDQIDEIYEENAKARKDIVPAVEKIIEKELPVLSLRMEKID